MARYNTPVRDWVKFYRHGKRNFGVRTLQQGVTQFGRKKKNGCKLISTKELQLVKKATSGITTPEQVAKNRAMSVSCKGAWPKINLKG